MVRHPIKRLESEWKMHLRLGNTYKDFNNALQFDMMLYNHGMYWKTLSHYLKHFKKEQILTIFMEDLQTSFDIEIARALKHIGADPQYKLTTTHSNSSKNYRKDTGVSTFLKGLLSDKLKSKIPDSLKGVLIGRITKEWDYNINWDPDVYNEVVQFFSEDSKALLEYCGKESDFWDFSFPGKR